MLIALDRNPRLEDAGPATLRTLAWFRQLLRIEHKPALLAARRLDRDPLPRGAGGADRMVQIILEVAASEPQLARQRGRRPRL